MSTLAVDFDGTITDYQGFKGKGVFDDPLPGAAEELTKLRKAGWEIIINTTRSEVKMVEEYLHLYLIPYDRINFNPRNKELDLSPTKLIADVYLDDRNLAFDGKWAGVAEKVKAFTTWRDRKPEPNWASRCPDRELYEETVKAAPPYQTPDRHPRPEPATWYNEVAPAMFRFLEAPVITPTLLHGVKGLLGIPISAIGSACRERAAKIFYAKNTARGGLWKHAGAQGAAIEIHAKLARLQSVDTVSTLEDEALDAVCDLFNYCIIFLMCIERKWIRPIAPNGRLDTAVVTGGACTCLGRTLMEMLNLNGYKAHSMPGFAHNIRKEADEYWEHFQERKVDVLINCYGTNHLAWLGEFHSVDFDIIPANLLWPIAVVDGLVKHGRGPCRILNIASQTYRVPQRCTAMYCASKAGLVQATKVMARELAPQGYVVNAIAPGPISDTDMHHLVNDQVTELRGWDSERRDAYALKNIPMGRYSNREEIATACLMLLKMPSYMNGAIIDVTGGQ